MAICGRPEFVIWLDTSDQILIERIMKRASRGDCRPDDNLESVKKRLKVYHESGLFYIYTYIYIHIRTHAHITAKIVKCLL